ncbi:MAG: SDR family oxidoreductase [Deltaproteobacteria bacterium]|nr:SDR family oxidoreductase [Deltaproteobacteria bacterium]
MAGLLAGRVALITGAAQGSGRGAALELAREGAACALVGRRIEPLETLAREIEALGVDALPLAVDVAHVAEIHRCVARTLERFHRLDVLVNAAQSPSMRRAPLLEISHEDLDALWKTGPVATLEFMRACHPHLQGGGSIVNFGSGAQVAPAEYGVYAGVKAAIAMITRAAAVEWGPHGIRANVVAPMVWSPANEEAMRADPALHERLVSTIPLGRIGDPEKDLGRVVVFLASDESRYVTGQQLMVDGGQQFWR